MKKQDVYYRIIVGGDVGSPIYDKIVNEITREMNALELCPKDFLRVDTVQGTPGIDLPHDGCTVGLWIGTPDKKVGHEEPKWLDELLGHGVPFLVVFHSQENFRDEIPKPLHHINGCPVHETSRIVETLLGLLHLLPSDRRAFISYCRKESVGVARQLFEALAHKGFNVYLDTASTRPGVDFQKTISSRLNEDDVFVLLDTPGINDSRWVQEEIAWINRFGTGVFRIIWPDVTDRRAGFEEPHELDDEQLEQSDGTEPSENRRIREDILEGIIKKIERLRIRSIHLRRSQIVENFLTVVNSHNKNLPGDVIEYRFGAFNDIWIKKRNNNTVCVRASTRQPNAIHLHQAHKEEKRPPTQWSRKTVECNIMKLLYDPTGYHAEHQEHLKWLHDHLRDLPVQTLRLNAVSDWLKEL